MTTEQKYRALLAEIGIEDDRQESALVDLLRDKDEALELERARVPDVVWVLEDRLMKEMAR